MHKLTDILLLVVTSVLCGAEDWDDMEEFGELQLDWLKKFGSFKNGIPSHDTISRVLAAINPDEFSKCFTDWIDCLRESVDNEVIAIDGKTICNSKDKSKGLSAVHIVSAYAAQNHLCLGQLATNSKSNEITAIPKLLKLLNVKGATITIDAMGCQREIAKEVIAAEANYLLAVKGNQPTLEQNIDDTIRFAKPIDSSESVDCGHGRVEKRHCTVYNNLEHIEHANQWSALKSIVVVNTERYTKATKKTEYQTRYYISNQIRTAKEFNKSVRSHWAIENNLHWNLDIEFREDYSRKRIGYAAQNYNVVLKLVLALVVKETTYKASKKRKRFRAILDIPYREKILNL